MIDHHHIQTFILYLRQKNRFSAHPFTKTQVDRLSPYTVSCYLRAIRSFWSWLTAEGIIEENPFHVEAIIAKAAKRAELEVHCTPHTMRRTACTLYYRNRVATSPVCRD